MCIKQVKILYEEKPQKIKGCNKDQKTKSEGELNKTEGVAQRYSVKRDALRNFAKFTVKQLCKILFINKVAGLSLQRY